MRVVIASGRVIGYWCESFKQTSYYLKVRFKYDQKDK